MDRLDNELIALANNLAHMQRNHPAMSASATAPAAVSSSLSSGASSSASSSCSSSAGSPPPPPVMHHPQYDDRLHGGPKPLHHRHQNHNRADHRRRHGITAIETSVCGGTITTTTTKPVAKRPFDIESLIGPDPAKLELSVQPQSQPLQLAAADDTDDDDILRRFPSIAVPAAYPATAPLMMPYGLHHTAAAAAAAIAFQEHQHRLHNHHHHSQLQQLQHLQQHQQHYLRYAAAASYFPHN